MRTVPVDNVTGAVTQLCIDTCTIPGDDVIEVLKKARTSEESAIGREILDLILENGKVARAHTIPLCQDTCMAVVE